MLDPRSTILPTAEFKFEAPAGLGSWRVRSFTMRENLGGSYSARIDLSNDDPDGNVEALAGASCLLAISRGPVITRRLRGLVRHATLEGWDHAGHLLATVVLVPALDFLGLGRDLRWFQGQTVPEILKDVLSTGLARYEREADLGQLYRVHENQHQDRAYAVRETCAQYNESDLTFASRLLEDDGIATYFDHDGKTEKMFLVDDNGAFPRLYDHAPIRLVPTAGRGHSFESLASFRIQTNPTPKTLVVNDQDLTRPKVPQTTVMRQAQSGDRAGPPVPYSAETNYRFPAGLTFTRLDTDGKIYQGSDLEVRGRLFFEESQVLARVCQGSGDVSAFAPGRSFVLESGHPQIDGAYLLVRVVHHANAVDAPAGNDSAGSIRRYWNEFECIPLGTPYRPPRRTPKPVAQIDRAVVVGAPGADDIETDKRGYVRVRFVGDHSSDETTAAAAGKTAWIPVAQGWLGAGMGQRIIPRRGMEVLVGYQDGDIDRPVVLTCLPTGSNVIPYDLPGTKTRTVFFRTASTPAGKPNWSELSVDDARDHEQVFLRAARDLKQQVLQDEHTEIGNNERREIGKNQKVDVGGDRTITIIGTETTTIHRDRKQTIAGSTEATVTQAEKRNVNGGRKTEIKGGDILALKGDRKVTVDGDDLVEVTQKRTVRVDQVLTVMQGPTTVEWADGHVDLNAGSWIRIKHGPASIQIDETGKVQITTDKDVGISAANISLAADNIAIEARTELKLAAGTGGIKLDAEGAAVSGHKVCSAGVVMNEISALMVKVN